MANPKNAGATKIDWSSAEPPVWTGTPNIPHVKNFKFTPEKPFKEWASSSTDGQKRKKAGKKDAFDGSFEAFLDEDKPFDVGALGIKTGVTGAFRVREPQADDTENDGTEGRTWVLPVYIDNVEYEYDIENDELISCTINFSQNGDITYPDDTTAP